MKTVKQYEKQLNRYRSVIPAVTVLFYIVFSLVRRFADSENLIILPLALFLANIFVLFEMYYVGRKLTSGKIKADNWPLIQLIINLGFVALCISYLI